MSDVPRPRYRIRPPEPLAEHHFVLVVLDSCRFDSFVAARPRHLGRLGELEKRYAYASWTPPAHYNLLMGLMPHRSPPQVYASEAYKQDLRRYDERLGTTGVGFEKMLPSLWLPTLLRRGLGYFTNARVSMPVLNPETPLNRDFDSFELMDRHNDFGAMLDGLKFAPSRPCFHLLNVGETHFPYAPVEEDPADWPKVEGADGVFEPLGGASVGGALPQGEGARRFSAKKMQELHQRQIECVRRVDAVFERLLDEAPSGTWITVTADHGEAFGEDGYFGHGPIHHPSVMEVPFVEGRVR